MTCNKATFRLIQSYLESLNTPRSLTVWLMFKYCEHDAILSLEVDPDLYLDPQSFRLDYLATKFLSKADFLSTKIDKKAVALEAFLKAEQTCVAINEDGFRSTYLKHGRFEWLHRATFLKIGSILSDFDGNEVCDCANWGPGVTLNRLVKRDTSSTNKFRHEGGITRDLYDFIGELHELAYPNWKVKFRLEVGNKIVTVPKNSKTDRTIAIEPGINLWYQKAIGTMIRRRLQRFGLNLDSQERNQQLALSGSKTGELATVDFSLASDSISVATVEALLPLKWFTLMDLSRSKVGLVEGSRIEYEKFSSMGNGFTFELETLIFYALALSVCNYLKLETKNVSVYGDDVILPVKAFDLYREMCKLYGFTVNVKKSYSSGHFRESCGSHFFAGIDCKPYFLRKVVESELDVYLAANSIRRLSRDPKLGYCDKKFYSCWRFLRSLVKRPCMISEGYGDVGLICNFDEATPSRARHGIEGYFCKALTSVPIGYNSYDHALLLARLKGRSVEIYLGNETYLRGRVKLSRKRLLIRRWANLGPWY